MDCLINSPDVSVIIPVFNEAPENLVASLTSIARQSYQNYECIVIDESNNEETVLACKRFCDENPKFTYIHPKDRLGLAGSLNLGISRSKGRYIARFDSDDICSLDRLQLQVNHLDANPGTGVLGGAIEIIDSHGNHVAYRKYKKSHFLIELHFLFINSMAHPALMIRKNIFESRGLYDQSYRMCEDLELWLRLINKKVKFENLDNVLIQYRQQTVHRDLDNWRYNLRARLKNFSYRYFPLRIIGIFLIFVWPYFPKIATSKIYSIFLFRK
jgi:glycosyltransferase involved in cell wall biosynthesis